MDDLRYTLEDRPPLLSNILYALQWVLIMLPLVTVTSNLMASFLGMGPAQATALFQRFLMVVGIVTATQCLAGHRYPLLDGPSAALLLSVAVLSGEGLAVISGGMLVGGGMLLLVGSLGLVGRVKALFTDRVVGVVLLLISMTLLPFLYPMVIGVGEKHPSGDPVVLVLTNIIIIVIVLISHWSKGLTRSLSVFVGIVVGCLGMAALGRMDVSGVAEFAWFAPPRPFLGVWPRLTLPSILSFALAYAAVLVNGLGSYFSVAEVVGRNGLEQRVERGIALTGMGGVLASLFGVVGTVSYSLSPGVILITRVGSRWPVFLAGLILFILAFFQKAGALLASVPDAVVGAALLVTLAAQVGIGISVLVRDGREMSVRDYLVVGLPLILGTTASMLPQGFLALFPPPTRALLGNGLIVGIAVVLLLEHGILRNKESGVRRQEN